MTKILAIDDEESCLEIIDFSLTSKGYEVFLVKSGTEALKFLKSNEQKIDLILLDMMMPGMDGVTTLEEIRKIDSTKYTPVVFQTGTSDYAPINRKQDEGNIDYIICKPYKREDLIEVIKTALKQ